MARLACLLTLALAACGETGLRLHLVPDPSINTTDRLLSVITSVELVLKANGAFAGVTGPGAAGAFEAKDVDADGALELVLTRGTADGLPSPLLVPGSNLDRAFTVIASGLTPQKVAAATGQSGELRFTQGEVVDIDLPFNLRPGAQPLRVIETRPASGATASAPTEAVVVFSREVDPGSVAGNLKLTFLGSSGEKVLPGTWSLSSEQVGGQSGDKRSVATLALCELVSGSYRLDALTGLKDSEGGAFDQDLRPGPDAFSATFTVVGGTGEGPCAEHPAVLPRADQQTAIVATLWKQVPKTGPAVCWTAATPLAASDKGLWDRGGYTSCDGNGEPTCAKGSRRVVTASMLMPDNTTMETFYACVLTGQAKASKLVATLGFEFQASGDAVCYTAADPTGAKAGYWDLGGYASCSLPLGGTAVCSKGSQPLVTAAMATTTGGRKYAVACVLHDQPRDASVVATLRGRVSVPAGVPECTLAGDPATSGGYWDLDRYGYCDSSKIPLCQNGARKVIIGMYSYALYTVYHCACVMTEGNALPQTSPLVATLSSSSTATTGEKCSTGGDSWDLGSFRRCETTGVPTCDGGARPLVDAVSLDAAGKTLREMGCVFPVLLSGAEAGSFADGRTLVVFAHQDDDLLWMQPFWPYASKLVLAAMPSIPLYNAVLTGYPAYYRQRWSHPLGEVTEAEFSATYLDPCKREAKVTLASIKAALEPLIKDGGVARVVTHNPWGEYGHAQHRLVSAAVRELAVTHQKDVWAISVRASKTPGGTYQDTGDLGGLQTITARYDRSLLRALKAVYQSLAIAHAGGSMDLWTWHDGEDEYPTGERQYVKLVSGGKDLTVGNTAIQQLVSSVPENGSCASP